MASEFKNLLTEAVALLHRLTTKDGILASTIEADNYKRIWARDSIICGISGILLEDDIIIDGLKNSLLTLAKNQHVLGMIPSNVLPDSNKDVSFGSLVGRVDTNTWFIIGACIYYLETSDEDSWNTLRPAVMKCRHYLKSIEFNDKGWIYTPLSGNWADEYPVHGYTLYDNALRIWGEKLWFEISGESVPFLKDIERKTWQNFWPAPEIDHSLIYQKSSFEEAVRTNPKHFCAFILPGVYDTRFDAAGNGLALLLTSLSSAQKTDIKHFLKGLKKEIGHKLIPAFWPVITNKSSDWQLLVGNYSYEFKNSPGNFHNGGIWPVWMGLFCMGLVQQGLMKEITEIINDFTQLLSKASYWNFDEYIDSNDLILSGKTQMGYTASGIVFMNIALQGQSWAEKLHI